MPGSLFPLGGPAARTPDMMRRMVFFSKMYPQTIFAEVTFGQIGEERLMKSYTEEQSRTRNSLPLLQLYTSPF